MAKTGHAIVAGVSWVLLVQAVLACGDSDDPADGGAAGAAGSAARDEAGSSGVMGTSGVGGARNAGRGSGSGGGGMMGVSGTHGAGSGGRVGLDDIDLTLGGLNRDLPAPSHDCLDMPTYDAGCMSFSGEYNGEAFAFQCVEASGGLQVAFVGIDSTRQIGCTLEFGTDDDLRVAVVLASPVFKTPPSTFEMPAGSGSFVAAYRRARGVSTHRNAEFLLADTHGVETQMAGETFLGPGRSAENTSEFARGAFAMTLMPISSCAADADDHGCDEIRLRGTFSARTMSVITILAAGQSCAVFPGRSRCGEGLECVAEPGQERGVCTQVP